MAISSIYTSPVRSYDIYICEKVCAHVRACVRVCVSYLQQNITKTGFCPTDVMKVISFFRLTGNIDGTTEM